MSSVASTKITLGAQPIPRSDCRASRKAVKKVRLRTSITAGVFILLTITLSVYGQSGNFHLSG